MPYMIGLHPGTPVAAGAGRVAAAALGAGLADRKSAQIVLGTYPHVVAAISALPESLPLTGAAHIVRAATDRGWLITVTVADNGHLTTAAAATQPSADGALTSLRLSSTRQLALDIAAAVRSITAFAPVTRLQVCGDDTVHPGLLDTLADLVDEPLYSTDPLLPAPRAAALLGARAASLMNEETLMAQFSPSRSPRSTHVSSGRHDVHHASAGPNTLHSRVRSKEDPMTAQMRRIVADLDRVTVETVERPEPGPRDALVRMSVTGVCGSDTHAVHGRHPFIPLPYHPGHEVVGVVESVGTDVSAVVPGQRVTVEPTLPCRHCKMCTTGRANLCENLQFFGCGWNQGGMADFFTIPADRLHIVPDDLDDLTAALIEPLSTPVHAVRLAGDVAGKAVAVLGAGPIGLLVLSVVRAYGARRIVVTDMLQAKRERALALGAEAVADAAAADVADQVRAALGESADVVFDCVAIQATVSQAVALASKGGTVVVVGVPAREVTVPLPVIQDHQIRVQGSATYLAEDYRESMRLLQTGAVRKRDIVTAVHELDEAADAFADAASGEHIKVLITATK
jgi:2-desacetyl-2-hydroxyethyl bacteriochlorophyllide A dehydrogenase